MADGEVRVFLDNTVKQRLIDHVKNPEEPSASIVHYVYGEILSERVHIVGCVACRHSVSPGKNGYPSIPDWRNEHNELSSLVPFGLQLCGVYYSCVKATNLEAIELKKIFHGIHTKDMYNLTSGKLVILQHCRADDSDRCFIYDMDLESISECEYQEADILGEFLERRISFRIQTVIAILLSKDQNDASSDVKNKIDKSCKDLNCGSTVFHIIDCNKLLKNQCSENGELETLEELLTKMGSGQEKRAQPQGYGKGKGKQKPAKTTSSTNVVKVKDVLEVKCLNQLSESKEDIKAFVPIIQCKKAVCSQLKVNLSLDVVLNLSRNTRLTVLPKLFISAMCSQLRRMGSVIEEFSKDGSVSVPAVHHFKPLGFCHLVTAVYPTMNDDQLASYRLELHKRLLLPPNRPLLRPSNRYVFENERQKGIYLTNPHTGLTVGACGSVAIVDGTYAYHHYMQDNFNDDGWGCAYRSLQTIASWFRHQGYTSNTVPSHRQIQQTLVDLQDKSEEFVGSRQWIGSFEVSMCLEQLLGVTSKIMFVSSGAEMRSKGRDLLHHFQTQGTPIMIGGGVLAHTILGVDFNDRTGDIRFLILDPHYTGGEDLKIILDKGWCGWKGPDFWNQQVHYNMCMPQRPDMI